MITSTSQTWRVYFNRHNAAPLVWSVSNFDGSFEMSVQDVQLMVPSFFVYKKKEVRDEDDGKPSGWSQCVGVLSVDCKGFVTISER